MEEFKTCNLCLINKPLSEFRNKRARCKICDSKYKNDLKEYVNSLKSAPCKDCGQSYPPYVMDFDHLNGTIKRANISALIGERTSIQSILQELDKCELVCANCHRKRTHNRVEKKEK